MSKPPLIAALAAVLGVAMAQPSLAAPRDVTVAVTLKDHHFTPAAISVPVGAKVRIDLTNQDAATEEFDSHDLKVEEVVTPHGHASFFIGPLKAGAYSFMGEFHPTTAQGRVTAS
jgi:plastocyanin